MGRGIGVEAEGEGTSQNLGTNGEDMQGVVVEGLFADIEI